MKKLLSWLLCLVVVVLLLPVTPAQAAPGVTVDTFMLSNEKGTSGQGGLIDRLITAGYGNNSLYEILQVLQPLSGGAIPDNFMAALAACPADCDVKTAVLNNFADESNNPIGIGSDGTLLVAPIYGRSFAEDDAFSTTTGNIALAGAVQFTAADSRDDAIDAGSNTISGKTYYYKAFAIAWMPDATDVPDAWAVSEVREAEQRGLVPPALQSEYTKTVTRSEFCSLAVLCVEQVKDMTVEEYIAAQHLTLPVASPFTDIAGLSQKEQADILAAYTLKIIAGTSPTTFNPNDKITREQAAKMLTSAAALGKTTEAALPTFADGGQIASWAAPYIGYVFNAKIMNGVGGNKFDPQGGYQRQQAYMTMLRLYKYMTGAA